MKKLLLISLLGLGLVACGQNIEEPKAEKETKGQEENIEVSENHNEDTEKEPEIKRTYPESPEVKKEVIDVENDQKDEKNEDKKSKDKKENPDKKEPEKKEEKDSEKSDKKLTEDDYFFSYGQIVSIKDGKVVDFLNDEENFERSSVYIPYSNNMVVMSDYEKNKTSIRKINGKDFSLMYEFKDGELFHPIGLIGDKIYGIHTYQVENEEGFLTPDDTRGGLSFVDLQTGKIEDYVDPNTAIQNDIQSAALLGDKIVFLRYGEGFGVDLYELEIKDWLNKEPKKIENEDKILFLLGAKHFSNDKNPTYDLVKATEGHLLVNDNKYQYAPQSGADAIGENVIILSKIGTLVGDEKFVFDMKIINFLKDELVLDTTKAYGYRVYDGKFYYIDENKEVKAIEIGL